MIIIVKTGFGYYKNAAGKIVSKAELPIGEHNLVGLTYVEVADQVELDAIEIYVDPADVAKADSEKKISQRIRKIAIDQLVAEGKLPADYTE